jgi:hypothetical protein
VDALNVSTVAQYQSWYKGARKATDTGRSGFKQWQQFIVHAIDERGDPIPDYQIELYGKDTNKQLNIQLDPDIYANDKSFRSYHIDVSKLVDKVGQLYVKVIAKSGSQLVDYHGIGSEKLKSDGLWDAVVPITLSAEDGTNFFQPLTTTLIELKLNRDPKPFDQDKVKLCYFGKWDQ